MRWGERNRARLRAWLPWVDSTRTLEDRKNFVRGTLEQFAGTTASRPASGMKGACQEKSQSA